MIITLPQRMFRFAVLAVFTTSLFTLQMPPGVIAAAEGILIKRVQLAGPVSDTSDHEYIELYNNSDSDIDVTDWCIQYNQKNLTCVRSVDSQTRIFMTARSSVLAMNPTLSTQLSAIKPDLLFGAAGNQLAVSSGSIRILNQMGVVVDTLGWVNGAAEGLPLTPTPPTGKLMQRRAITEGVLIDADNNSTDFENVTQDSLFNRGGLYEHVVLVDMCLNTPDVIDEVVPEGSIRDTDGICHKDLCSNVPGLQIAIPNGYHSNESNCLPIILTITEVLPNVSGSDTGKEFVELHNPSEYLVNLQGYILQLNPSAKRYIFTEPISISPGEYLTFSDTQLGFVLPNTSASISILMPDQVLLHETDSYMNPKDDYSWAMINNTWQYTQRITRGGPNQSPDSVVNEEVVSDVNVTDELAPCAVGKYRNPETNRCKNIEGASSDLAPCAADQERNPETNRCRKITTASASLVPCNPDQERNPETNRCRKTGSAESTLKPCAEGQERNPETNRCRKVGAPVDGTVLAANTHQTASGPLKYKSHLIALLVVSLLGYGLFEYRRDIRNYIEKVTSQKFRRGPKN